MAGTTTPGFATQQEAYAALIRQGATPQLAGILAAITRPESSGYTAASNGTYLGLWQIGNYHGFDNNRLLSNDIDYQAAAALQIYHQQGLGAWETYTNGSYQKYLQAGNSPALPPQGDLSNFSDVGPQPQPIQQLAPATGPSVAAAPDTGASPIDQPGTGLDGAPSPIDGPAAAAPGGAADGPIGFDLSLSPSGG